MGEDKKRLQHRKAELGSIRREYLSAGQEAHAWSMGVGGFRKLRPVAVIGMLMLVLASMLGPVSPSNASASVNPDCYAASCQGIDPSTTNCVNDAYTGASKEIEDGILELRYSPSCKANWARYIQYGKETIGTWLREAIGQMGRSGSKAWIWIPGQAPVGSINDTVTGTWGTFGPGDTTWTAMVDGTTKVCTSVAIVYSTPDKSGMDFDRIEENYDGKCG